MAQKPKIKVKAPRAASVFKRKSDGKAISRKATLADVYKNAPGAEDTQRATGAASGIHSMSSETSAAPARSVENQIGAEQFATDWRLKMSRETIRKVGADRKMLERELAQAKRRPGHLLGISRGKASEIEKKIEKANGIIAKEEQVLEYELEAGERAYREAKEKGNRINALVQEFEQQTADGGQPRGRLSMTKLAGERGRPYVVAPNGFPAHLTPDEIEKLGEEHGYQAHEFAQSQTWDLLRSLQHVKARTTAATRNASGLPTRKDPDAVMLPSTQEYEDAGAILGVGADYAFTAAEIRAHRKAGKEIPPQLQAHWHKMNSGPNPFDG
jgi:hypothetical protein